jgi:isoleucyl-tRNA synthetase
MIDKYGVDTLRLWMYGVNQPGESKNFDEKTVMELNRQVFGLLYNVLTFYELYRDKDLENIKFKAESNNILDKWILAKLDELIDLTTVKMDDYKVLEPTRSIKDFIGDLSTWYLRRSRDRIKEGDKGAKQTLYFVLKTLAKVMAPFAPFSAEDIYLKLRNENNKESVHLENWPEVNKVDSILVNNMEEVRKIVSLGLEARQKAGLKVRQPLASLKLKLEIKLSDEYLELIKDEVNIKEVIFDDKIEGEVLLDVNITPELKIEGDYRELVRAIQDLRKKEELISSDVVVLDIETNTEGQDLINKFKEDLVKTINAKEINFSSVEGEEVKVNDLVFKIKIIK